MSCGNLLLDLEQKQADVLIRMLRRSGLCLPGDLIGHHTRRPHQRERYAEYDQPSCGGGSILSCQDVIRSRAMPPRMKPIERQAPEHLRLLELLGRDGVERGSESVRRSVQPVPCQELLEQRFLRRLRQSRARRGLCLGQESIELC